MMQTKFKSNQLGLFLITSILLACNAQAGDASSSRPMAGWRYSPSDEANFSQTVNYPATAVNSGGHALNALIMGDIKAQPKSKTPYQLVINGANMPLAVDEAGHYERPYAFGAGSNSIEIKNGNAVSLLKRQFYEANPNKVQAKLRIILAWDSDHTDVDLHVITPKGEHAWYGQRVIPSGGAIDIDATDGYGPEIFATPNAEHGNYQVYANYYGGNSDDKIITLCKIAIITNENTPNEKQQNFVVPLRKAGELTLVKRFVY
ncbi:MAG: DUF2135 domain-containing protein [Methylophilus sp.]|jgi:uncharacterized protein YfaP (DUF2135 family)